MPSPDNRRREERVAASGLVELRPASSLDKIVAHLVDVSNSGFRVTFTGATLFSGDRVAFSSSDWSGTAIVVWCRIAGDVRECGFLVHPAEKANSTTP